MPERSFSLHARVSTDHPNAVRPVLERWFAAGSVRPGDLSGEFVVEGVLTGTSARDLNRTLLTALRAAEKRTRLRSEWTAEGVTERFFDYVPKGKKSAARLSRERS